MIKEPHFNCHPAAQLCYSSAGNTTTLVIPLVICCQ